MKAQNSLWYLTILSVVLTMISCSSPSANSDAKNQIAGKYASQSETTFDYYKDTLEIKPSNDGKFEVTVLARWTSAKKDDPNRPVNKVAGVWNKGKQAPTLTADFQGSDTTLRITDPFSSKVTILFFDLDKGIMTWPNKDGEKQIYTKIRD